MMRVRESPDCGATDAVLHRGLKSAARLFTVKVANLAQ